MKIQNVQQAIQELENIDPLDNHSYEKTLLAYTRVQQIPFLILELDKPFTVFKTRTHETDDFFENISDLALPPQNAVKSFGRCNRPFQPMFYSSDFRQTSYMELLEYWAEGKIKNEYINVTISKWKVSKPINTLIITSPHAQERTSSYDRSHGHAMDHFINQYDGEYKEALILFYQFLFNRFRKPAKKDLRTYLITSAYCGLAFVKAAGNLDAVFYPSVPYAGEGVNFAFNANFDFSNHFDPVLVARNTFVITETQPQPVFTESNLIKATKIDLANGGISW